MGFTLFPKKKEWDSHSLQQFEYKVFIDQITQIAFGSQIWGKRSNIVLEKHTCPVPRRLKFLSKMESLVANLVAQASAIFSFCFFPVK